MWCILFLLLCRISTNNTLTHVKSRWKQKNPNVAVGISFYFLSPRPYHSQSSPLYLKVKYFRKKTTFHFILSDIRPMTSIAPDKLTLLVCYLNFYVSTSLGILSAIFSYLVRTSAVWWSVWSLSSPAVRLADHHPHLRPGVAGAGVPGQ